MLMIKAIIRPDKTATVLSELCDAGFPAVTKLDVVGRGKQRGVKVGDIFTIPISHGEGRLISNEKIFKEMTKNGQIATQYVDFYGNANYDGSFNPNGSFQCIEGITSPDGRILGKMGHSERIGKHLYKNIAGKSDQRLFEAGISYFK